MQFQFKRIRIILFITFACVLGACVSTTPMSDTQAKANAVLENTDFAKYKEDFIEELWEQNPGWALYNGYYKYDDKLIVPTAKNRVSELQNTKQALSELQKFNPKELSVSDATDYFILENALQSMNGIHQVTTWPVDSV